MAGADFKRDSAGIAEILVSGMFAPMVHAAAASIAANVRGTHPDADVVVDDYVTDRNASSVTVRDVRAKIWEVRDGLLIRSASGAGLEVKSHLDRRFKRGFRVRKRR